MSEQAHGSENGESFHPVIEENFETSGVDMGRFKNTDLAHDTAINDDFAFERSDDVPTEDRLANAQLWYPYGDTSEEVVKSVLAREAIDKLKINPHALISHRAVHKKGIPEEDKLMVESLEAAHKEAGKVAWDYDLLRSKVRVRNAKAFADAHKG